MYARLSGTAWRTSIACLDAIPQHTFEHHSLPMLRSREPTHCTQQIRLGGLPVDGTSTAWSFSWDSRSCSVSTSGYW